MGGNDSSTDLTWLEYLNDELASLALIPTECDRIDLRTAWDRKKAFIGALERTIQDLLSAEQQ